MLVAYRVDSIISGRDLPSYCTHGGWVCLSCCLNPVARQFEQVRNAALVVATTKIGFVFAANDAT